MKKYEKLPQYQNSGLVQSIALPLMITVQPDSFLHIGATKDIKYIDMPVFKINKEPVIPASSFKGAFRSKMEFYLIKNKDSLKNELNLSEVLSISPCIPASRLSNAENSLLKKGYRTNCHYSEGDRDKMIPQNGICPVCYFFGCGGLPGVLRIGNFFTGQAQSTMRQTNIRQDRYNQTAAPGAKVEGEQVKPGTIFKGTIEIIIGSKFHRFGEPRIINGVTLDKWLEGLRGINLEDRQLWLINQLLIPSLEAVTILGGQRSKGAGRVSVELTD